MAEDPRKGTDIPAEEKRGKRQDKDSCKLHEPYDRTYADKGFRIDGGTILARYTCQRCGGIFSLPVT